jgi:hypothetical protein
MYENIRKSEVNYSLPVTYPSLLYGARASASRHSQEILGDLRRKGDNILSSENAAEKLG